MILEEDPEPDTSYLTQPGFEERQSAHESGELGFLTVRIEAVVFIEDTEQTLVSPGLRSVESDLDDDEIDEIISEEWRALRAVLKTVGTPTENLPIEVQHEWLEWRT